jgi:uncharacterized membrane protein
VYIVHVQHKIKATSPYRMQAELKQIKKDDYTSPTSLLLSGLVALYIVLNIIPKFVPGTLLLLSGPMVGVVFALIHGSRRYGWGGILALLVISLVVSNIMENASILTGFPFGHYYYTAAFGPKLFNVPLVIGVTYFSIGYLAWTLSTILVGNVRRYSSAFQILVTPLIAAFMMTSWDLALDPIASTINHDWIWEQGGGYFGVPLTNYLGWFFTVFLFLLFFALYLRFRRSDSRETHNLSKLYYAQPIVMYALLGISFILSYVLVLLSGVNTPIMDAAGTVWQSLDIYETSAIASIYTLLFIAVLAGVRLLEGSSDNPKKALEPGRDTQRTVR